ncbi:MAG: PEP-CTERM sorting domain-containing protein [Phycisphaerales bacterium]|nr:PEP-CTERM sorting domain-containing protein [Phycisphaerales bacterium]
MAGSASAADVFSLGTTAQPTPIFDANASPSPQWDIPSVMTSGGTMTDFNFFPDYYIDPQGISSGHMVWSGNALDQDLSAGGDAEATFLGGGTFQLYGTVYTSPDFGTTFTPFSASNILLVEGTVGAFHVKEPNGGDNLIDKVGDVYLNPTAGALVDGTIATMPGLYSMNFTIQGARQDGGGPLQDFQTSVYAINTMELSLTYTGIPEPSTLALLAGAGLLGLRRRGARR